MIHTDTCIFKHQYKQIRTNTVAMRTDTYPYIPEADCQNASCPRMRSAAGASHLPSCGTFRTDILCMLAASSTPHPPACLAQTACLLSNRFRLQLGRQPAAPVKHFAADSCELCHTKTFWGTCISCTSGTRHSKTRQPRAGRREGLPRKCSFVSTLRQPTGES